MQMLIPFLTSMVLGALGGAALYVAIYARRLARAAGRRSLEARDEVRSHRREVNNLTTRIAQLEHHLKLAPAVVHQRDLGDRRGMLGPIVSFLRSGISRHTTIDGDTDVNVTPPAELGDRFVVEFLSRGLEISVPNLITETRNDYGLRALLEGEGLPMRPVTT